MTTTLDSTTLLRRFFARSSAFALQRDDGSYRGGIDQPLTDELLQRHLDGAITVGAYQVDDDGKARCFCVDVDSDGSEAGVALARKVADRVVDAGRTRRWNLLVEFSGSKGFHVWGLFDNPVPWPDAYSAAAQLLVDVGCEPAGARFRDPETGLEGDIFPQPRGEGRYGKLVKLPLGVHRKTGARSYFVNGNPVADAGIEPATIPDGAPQWHGPTGAREWDGELLPWYGWMDAVVEEGFGEGFRNKGLYIVASWLVTRSSLGPAGIEALVWYCAGQCAPPLEDREVERILKSAWRQPLLGLCLEELQAAGVLGEGVEV